MRGFGFRSMLAVAGLALASAGPAFATQTPLAVSQAAPDRRRREAFGYESAPRFRRSRNPRHRRTLRANRLHISRRTRRAHRRNGRCKG